VSDGVSAGIEDDFGYSVGQASSDGVDRDENVPRICPLATGVWEGCKGVGNQANDMGRVNVRR